MRNFNKLSLFFMKVLEIFLLVLFFALLVFIVKWRIDHLYANSLNNGEVNFKITDELIKTKTEILGLMGKTDEEYKIPVVKEKEMETNKKESVIINVPANTDKDALGEILMSKNLIADINEYNRLVDDMGIGEKILPGHYEIKEGMKVKEILADISGNVLHEYKFNISEGASAADVGNMLEDIGMIESSYAFVEKCKEMNKTQFVPGEHHVTMPLKVAKIIEQITV